MEKTLTPIFLIFFLIFQPLVFSKQTFIYNSETGGKSTKYVWTVLKKDNQFHITSEGSGSTVKIEALAPYQIKTFNSLTPKKDRTLDFQLNGKKLIASSKIKGEDSSKSYSISTSWVQEFEFGLQNFLQSKDSSFEFVILNPKTLDINNMIAKKQGKETIEINKKSYDAQIVKVTLTGFKSMFWKAMIWYDISTHDLLIYKANEGPHTTTTTVTFESKEGNPDSIL